MYINHIIIIYNIWLNDWWDYYYYYLLLCVQPFLSPIPLPSPHHCYSSPLFLINRSCPRPPEHCPLFAPLLLSAFHSFLHSDPPWCDVHVLYVQTQKRGAVLHNRRAMCIFNVEVSTVYSTRILVARTVDGRQFTACKLILFITLTRALLIASYQCVPHVCCTRSKWCVAQ